MAPSTTTGFPELLAADVDAAFPELVSAHVDGLFSGVLRLTNDRHAAEDIVQETFLRAHRALHGYSRQRRAALKTAPWLWTIALNLCRNRARGLGRRPRQVSLDAAVTHASGDDTAAEAIEAIDTTWGDRLAALAEAERTAVVLRHVVGLSYSELAAAVERPIGTVKSDVHRGLQRLRSIMEHEGSTAA